MKNSRFVAIICGYVALIILFVLSGVFGWQDSRFLMALPVFFLSMACFIVGNGRAYWMPLALMFSAVADLFGSFGLFIPQVVLFTLAHIALIIYFLRNSWLRPSLLLFCLLVAGIGIGLGFFIVPGIAGGAEKGVVVTYIIAICLMCMSAILWSKERKSWYMAAAITFMVSDALIGLTRFGGVEIPYGSVIIMTAYYAAQLMFAGAYLSRFVNSRKYNPAIMA